MLNKTPLLHQRLGPCVFLSFSLSLRLTLWSTEARWAHFLARRLTPSWEGALCLHPLERAPGAYMKQCKLCVKSFIGFLRKPRNISLFLSLFYFLIIDSGPPGFGPLKDLNNFHKVSHSKDQVNAQRRVKSHINTVCVYQTWCLNF